MKQQLQDIDYRNICEFCLKIARIHLLDTYNFAFNKDMDIEIIYKYAECSSLQRFIVLTKGVDIVVIYKFANVNFFINSEIVFI